MHAFIRRALAIAAATLATAAAGPAAALDLQGHRGARALAPENTIAGFARALRIGVTTLELDLAVTRDDQLVISHDPALNADITRGPDGRFLDGRGPLIRTLSLDELRRYDVGRIKPGTDYAKRFPLQEPVDGARVPKLDELFALVRRAGNADVRFAIETKVSPLAPDDTIAAEDFARRTIAAIRAGGVERRSTVLSFDWRVLQVVQREAPEIGTVHLSAQQSWLDNIGAGQAQPSPWTAGIRHADHASVPRMVKAAGGRIWSAFFGDLDPAKVREAQALGLQVLAWTVNSPADIERLIDWGVDGIVSDRPDLVREAMERRGLPLPKPTPVDP